MTWYEIKAKYPSLCCECREQIQTGDECWFSPPDGKTGDNGIVMCKTCNEYLARKGIIGEKPQVSRIGASVASTTPTRDEMIAKAHAENMAANTELVMAIRQLTVAVNDRTRLLVKNLEAK